MSFSLASLDCRVFVGFLDAVAEEEVAPPRFLGGYGEHILLDWGFLWTAFGGSDITYHVTAVLGSEGSEVDGGCGCGHGKLR